MRLSDLATVVRSKNAGPYQLTLDVFFANEEAFRRARDSGAMDAQAIELRYGAEVVGVWFVESALAWKATLVRSKPAGNPGDPDVFGAQQHLPLLDIEIPDVVQRRAASSDLFAAVDAHDEGSKDGNVH